MGEGFEIDLAVVVNSGARIVRSAEILKQQAIDAGRFGFVGSQAGREYTARGEALSQALGAIAVVFEGWASAMEQYGRTVAADAARYGEIDEDTAANVNRVRW